MSPRDRSRASEGAALVRLRATGTDWVAHLPPSPGDRVLTVTVGHSSLLPVPVDDLIVAGYRIVGVAAPGRPVGQCVDVLVPAEAREEDPDWWARLLSNAERVFDLRMGPVWAVLGDELEQHLAATG